MKLKATLAVSAAALLAACGGGSSGTSNNPTVFGSIPTRDISTIVSFQDGSGIASAYNRGNSYLLYTAELDKLDLDSQANIDFDALTVVEEGSDYLFLEGNYVDGGNSKYLFIYIKQIGDDEGVAAGLTRNSNIAGGEVVQAYGDIVSGQVPVGDVVYRGYNLLTNKDQSAIDSGTFTMRVNFQRAMGSLSGSGDVSFVEADNFAIDTLNGTFASDEIRLGYIDGDSTSGSLRGNFHGEGATGVTGIYGNNGELAVVGVIAGSR